MAFGLLRLPASALAFCGALAALAPAATAATVGVEDGQVVFAADPGEVNDPWFRLSRPSPGVTQVEVTERAAVQLDPGSGCTDRPLGGAQCAVPTSSEPLVVRLGDGADGGTTDSSGGGDLVVGPSGHPRATVRVLGEAGNDLLELGTELDTPLRVIADGGAGDDTLHNPQGQGDVLGGGPGTDTLRLVRGLTGNERQISLDGQADDDLLGDTANDNVTGDVEDVDANTGCRGPVHLIGSEAANTLLGGGCTSSDVLDGRGGNDTLMGITGDNRLIGGAGRDSLTGGNGNDVIEARDGERDQVGCGIASADVARVDELDTVAPDCDRVAVHKPRIKSKRLRVRKGRVKVKVACPVGGPRCTGKLKLKTARKVRIGGKRRKLTLARGRYGVRPGTTKRARARLTRRGRTAVRRSGRLRVKIELCTVAGTRISRRATLR